MAYKKINNFNVFDHHTYYVPGVADMFVLLAWLLAGALIGNLVSLAFATVLGGQAGTDYAMVVAYPLMFIPAMIYASVKSRVNCYNRKGIKLDSSNFGGKYRGPLCALVVFAATIAMGICIDPVTALMPDMPEWLENVMKSLTNGAVWANVLCVSIFAPFFEEWLCRGQVLRGLLNNGIKPVWAVVLSAVFFAVIHANPWQAIPAFALGLLFGYVYYKTGSLKLTMLMHCTNNTFAIICSNIDGLEDMTSWAEVLDARLYWIVVAASIIVVVLSVLFFKRIPIKTARGGCEEVPKLFD